MGDLLGQMTLQSTQPTTLDGGTQVASDPVSSQIAQPVAIDDILQSSGSLSSPLDTLDAQIVQISRDSPVLQLPLTTLVSPQ